MTFYIRKKKLKKTPEELFCIFTDWTVPFHVPSHYHKRHSPCSNWKKKKILLKSCLSEIKEGPFLNLMFKCLKHQWLFLQLLFNGNKKEEKGERKRYFINNRFTGLQPDLELKSFALVTRQGLPVHSTLDPKLPQPGGDGGHFSTLVPSHWTGFYMKVNKIQMETCS